jgi:hypothetical protein
VAPDHPKIQSVTRVYEKTAARPGFRFFGGVAVGEDVLPADLLERYHAVVYAVGTATDNRLGVPGEDRPGSVPATEFVAWCNGHPGFADHEFALACRRAVVVGHGNVAIDVARMLVLDPQELRRTDVADHAIDRLSAASIDEVVLLGRRGPAQAAFTNPSCASSASCRRRKSSSTQASSSSTRTRRRGSRPMRRRPHVATSSCCAATPRVTPAPSPSAWCCASCARPWRSSATAATTGQSPGFAWSATASCRTRAAGCAPSRPASRR